MREHQYFTARRRRQFSVLFVGLLLATSALYMFRSDSWAATRVGWRSLSHWSVGFRRVSFPNDDGGALRGWRAEFGPVFVAHLREVPSP